MEWFYGLLNVISIRNLIRLEESGEIPINKEDMGTKKGKKVFNSKMAQSDGRMASAHAALTKKFPGMMK